MTSKHMREKKQEELAFLMVKPDGVQRRLIGEILQRVEKTHLELIVVRALRPSAKLAAAHYRSKRNGSSGLTAKQAVAYLTAGPVFASIWQGKNAVSTLRAIVGSKTDPGSCRKGTIRKDFAQDSLSRAMREHRAVKNVVHSSNNPQSAMAEIALWFGKNWRKQYDKR